MTIEWEIGQKPVHDHNKSELVERLVQKAFECHISDVPEKVIIRSVLPAPVIMVIFLWAEKFFRGCPHESRKVKDGVHITISIYLEAEATDYDTIHIYLSPNSTRITDNTSILRVAFSLHCRSTFYPFSSKFVSRSVWESERAGMRECVGGCYGVTSEQR